MADTCHGAPQFAKLVKRETGDSPMVYLNRLRIERAKHMLTARKASIVKVNPDVWLLDESVFFKTI